MIIDHIGLAVSDLESSQFFFSAALAPLGIVLVAEDNGWVGFGKDGTAQFWFGEDVTPLPPMHIAFCADSRKIVRAFYTAALGAGGIDNGAPGIRDRYHAHYYGAFVISPDGHNIEAVCHVAEG